MLRVAVIGARARRQGIGGHLARFLVQHGAEVVAVAGTSEATAAEAARAVAADAGALPRPWGDAALMIAREGIDAVVIASPHASHEGYLRAALDRGLHVLSEKPLCWGGPDPVGAAEEIARRFAERRLHLLVNTQWPWTLGAYRELHPGSLTRPPREFRMLLSPRSEGPAMVPDAIPHALSLLSAVLPDPGATLAEVRVEAPGPRALDVRFVYRADAGEVDSLVELRTAPEPPRPAAYAFDGREARRVVEGPRYALFFEAEGRRVAVPDPTPRLVGDFVRRVSSGARAVVDPAGVPGMRMLGQVWEAVKPA
jgi:predicted dehydrogenase